ncbi:FCS-Like Zinc finger 1 isoform X2 [Manihot esculenta]|uniref:Uncharacterized protein n=1 Tax=Manihot esculenta TaxID=3983 RepID=A0ACB7GDS6_MANES|nr:FCS-Like Zinc finger 1 isoform X2 [Manihot esculenta]KAG8637880.1 hypothetical protein MANES_15G171400v8 [Manihot esculenta]
MDSSSWSRRPRFVEECDFASLSDMKAGFSGNHRCHHHHPFFSQSLCYGRTGCFSNLPSFVDSPRSTRFYDARFENYQPHFLEACFLCKKPLGNNKDIFMYSEECRQEQIEIDEAKDLSSSMKALRKKDQKKTLSPTKTQDYPSRTGAVAAA